MEGSKKSISQNDVVLYFRAAPLEVLEYLQQELNKYIDRKTNTDVSRSNIRNVLYDVPEVPVVPSSIFDGAPMPGQILQPKSQAPKAVFSNAPMPQEVPEKPKYEMGKHVDVESYDATLMFVYGDNYGDGLFKVVTPELQETFKQKKKECVEKGIFYPYGYGKGSDLLKVKKFIRPSKDNQPIRVTLNVKYWKNNNREGYSCYKADT